MARLALIQSTMGKILVIDNDRDMCCVVADVLKEENHRVNIAHDGESALSRIRRQRFDLMIVDYKLFGISGLTLLEEAREIRPSLITIMISAFGNECVRARAKRLGAYEFLDKPFHIKKLAKVVRKALNKRGA